MAPDVNNQFIALWRMEYSTVNFSFSVSTQKPSLQI